MEIGNKDGTINTQTSLNIEKFLYVDPARDQTRDLSDSYTTKTGVQTI